MSASPRRYEELSGSEMAAAVLMTLPAEHSAGVLRLLRDTQLERITTKLLQHDQLAQDVLDRVLHEAHDQATAHVYIRNGGVDYARNLLGQALGSERANDIIDKLLAKLESTPFHYLDGVEASQIATFLNNEHPQIVALVLSYLSSGQSAAILALLSEKLQPQVSVRLANMDTISPAAVAQVEAAFKKKLSAVLNTETRNKTGGIDFLVRVLTQVDRTTERQIMDQLEQTSPELSDDIKKRMFVFENIIQMDDRSIQRVLRDVDSRDLALALRGASSLVRDCIFRNMSSRAAATVREEIESSPPVRLRNIEEAQQRIVDIVRRLEEEEEVVVSRGSGDVLL